MATVTLRQALVAGLSDLNDNTVIIDNSDELGLNKIKDGVLIVSAAWSGQAITNSINAIKILYENDYSGQIIVVDIDCMNPSFQQDLFGAVCQGWGEIFVVHQGQIVEKYLGKDSFTKLKASYLDRNLSASSNQQGNRL